MQTLDFINSKAHSMKSGSKKVYKHATSIYNYLMGCTKYNGYQVIKPKLPDDLYDLPMDNKDPERNPYYVHKIYPST